MTPIHHSSASRTAAVIAFLALVFPVAAAPAGFFPAKTFSSGGSGPSAIAVGDFNGDGLPDVVVANQFSNNLLIFLGTGGGNFRPPIQIALAFSDVGYVVALGDFNNDGKLDIAATNERSGIVWVFLGNGDGTFQAPVTSDSGLGGSILSVTTGDLDNDGNLDLYFGANGSGQALLGNGDGTFIKSPFANHPAGSGVALADFNRDGFLDVVGTDIGNAGDFTIALGNGDGTFLPLQARGVLISNPVAAVAGDFNGDGTLDVAIVEIGNGTSVFLGNGDGTFGPEMDAFAGNSPVNGVAADFDGDGILDMAVSAFQDGGVSLLKGDGQGHLAYSGPFLTGSGANQLATGYFDNNGSPDLAVSNYYDNTFSILLNQSNFSDFELSNPSPISVRLAANNQSTLTSLSISSLGNFQSPVSLSCAGLPSGFSCSFSPAATVTPKPGLPVAINIALNVPNITPGRDFGFEVVGTSSGSKEKHSQRVSATWPDFRINDAGDPTRLPGTPVWTFPGQVSTVHLRLRSLAGYSNSVSISCQAGSTAPPATCTPSSPVLTPPTSFTLDAAGSLAQDYNFELQGVGSDSNSTTHNLPMTLHVMDYTLGTPSSNSGPVLPGQTLGGSVLISPVNNFFGEVNLFCQTDNPLITCTFSNPISIQYNPQNALFIINVSPNAQGGTYNVAVLASAQGDNRPPKSSGPLVIQVMDFSIAVNPASATIFPGQTATYNGMLSSINGFGYYLSLSCTPGVTSPPAKCTILPTSSPPPSTFTVTASDSIIQDFNFNVVAQFNPNGPFGHQVGVVLRVVDMRLGPLSPSSVSLAAGNISQPVSFQLVPVGSFSAPVTLDCPSLPPQLSCRFNGKPAPVSVWVSGGPANVLMDIVASSAASPNSYPQSITATTTGRPTPTQSDSLLVTVSSAVLSTDLSVTMGQPAMQTIVAVGQQAVSTVTISNNGNPVSNGVVYITSENPVFVESAAFGGGTLCTGSGSFTSVVTCNVGPIPTPGEVTITVAMRPGFVRALNISSIASSELSDIDLTNNTASTSIQVRPRPFARRGLGLRLP